MGINRTSLSSSNLATNTNVAIEIVYIEPKTEGYLETPRTPNQVFGFYDSNLDAVRLYVVDDSGLRALPVV